MKLIPVLMTYCIFLFGCKQGFEPVDYGHDVCTNCKMTIMDRRFAAEIVTGKGKTIKFDDIACLIKYKVSAGISDKNIQAFVSDYNHPGQSFLDAKLAVYLHSDIYKSPMNGNCAAFPPQIVTESQYKTGLAQTLLSWGDLVPISK